MKTYRLNTESGIVAELTEQSHAIAHRRDHSPFGEAHARRSAARPHDPRLAYRRCAKLRKAFRQIEADISGFTDFYAVDSVHCAIEADPVAQHVLAQAMQDADAALTNLCIALRRRGAQRQRLVDLDREPAE